MLGLVILCFVYFLYYCLVVSTSGIDCLEKLVSEITYYVLSGHSLTLAGDDDEIAYFTMR